MSTKVTIVQFLTLLILPCFVAAHPTPLDSLSQAQGSSDVVDVETRLSHELVPAGANFRAAVMIHIAEGWHVNAHRPTLDYLIGTDISVQENHGVTLRNTDYPESHKLNFGFADEAIAVYEGKVPVITTFFIPDSLKSGSYSVSGALRVQACKGQVCLSPATINFNIPVQVVSQSGEAVTSNEEFFNEFSSNKDRFISGTQSEGGRNEIAAMFEEQGYFWAFLGIFFIGLALNLTPCVYPMLSVTVSLFGNENKSEDLAYSFAMASAYVIGIAFMYSLLGVGAAYTGSLFGSWLQSPW
jgi:thiol:disulfide interchange protein DsbD